MAEPDEFADIVANAHDVHRGEPPIELTGRQISVLLTSCSEAQAGDLGFDQGEKMCRELLVKTLQQHDATAADDTSELPITDAQCSVARTIVDARAADTEHPHIRAFLRVLAGKLEDRAAMRHT